MITERLDEEIALMQGAGMDPIMTRYVRRNGQLYTPAPYDGERRAPKECFKNCADIMHARPEGLTYVEGFGLTPRASFLVHHAWLVTPAGVVVDPTWETPELCEYFGVSIPFEEAWAEMFKQGFYGVFGAMRINTDYMAKKDPGLVD